MANRPLTIYKASAGSGKTYTLTLRYITLLLGVKDADGAYRLNHKECLPPGEGVQRRRHRHILAVTFTNKATDEMKQRIIKELQALATMPAAGGGDAAYAGALTELFGCTRVQLAEAANEAMRQIIFDYSQFHVSTIDAFFQNVLRAMAYEFERQGDYEITMDLGSVINMAIDSLLDDYNTADSRRRVRELAPLDHWIHGKMRESVTKGEEFNVFQSGGKSRGELVDFVSSFFDEGFADYGEAMGQWLGREGSIKEFGTALDNAVARLKNELEALMDAANAAASAYKLKRDPKKILENQEAPKADSSFFKRAVAAAFGHEPFGVEDIASKGTPTQQEAQPILAALNGYARYLADIKTLEAVRKYIGMYGLQKLVLERVEQWRRDNNILLLGDAADLISKFVTPDDVPFMYERMGVDLRHFLIDEFQDTSRLQWKNLKPLLGNSLASGYDNLIIGDEKQSIYRFRNSDSSLLRHEVAGEFPDDAEVRGVAAGENTNHRSAVEIVRFNNTLFRYIAQSMELADGGRFDGFDNIIQDIPERHRDFHGRVRVIMPPAQDAGDKDVDTDAPDEGAAYAVEDEMIRHIRSQHDAGYRWGDIAVLTDTNNQASDCVTALINEGIPVVSADALEIDRARSVSLVVSVMRLIDNLWNITDEAAAKGRTTRRVRASMMQCRFEYALHHSELDEEAASDPQALAAVIEKVLDELSGDYLGEGLKKELEEIIALHPSTLMSLAEMIVERFVPQELATKEMFYLSALSDTLADYTALYGSDIHDFLRWWDRQSKHPTIKSSGDTDAVNIVTIHSAKGLQYPCVHLPYMKFSLVDDRKSERAWLRSDIVAKLLPGADLPPALFVRYDSGMAGYHTAFGDAYKKNCRDRATDSINKAYVALTRPERELYIYVSEKSAKAFAGAKDGDTGLSDTAPFDLTILKALSAIDGDSGIPEEYRHRDPAVTEKLSAYFAADGGYDYGSATAPEHGGTGDAEAAGEEPALEYNTYVREDASIVTRVDAITRLGDGDMDDVDDIDAHGAEEDRAITDGVYENEQMRLAAIRGKILHEVLSDIRRPGDIDDDAVMTTLCRRASAHQLRHSHDYQSYIDELRALFGDGGANDAGLHRWFVETDEYMEEQPIFVPPAHPEDEDDMGRVLRPDRVVVHNGVMEVVDFKFTTQEYPAHHRQVAEYCRILHLIYPDIPIRGYLWYLDQHRVAQVL